MEDIFCKIIKGEAKADFVYQDKDFIVIKDIIPQAPVHLLIIPKRHVSVLELIKEKNYELLGKMILTAHKAAQISKIEERGYRLILNYGPDSQWGITDHIHLHLLGGKKLGAKIVR